MNRVESEAHACSCAATGLIHSASCLAHVEEDPTRSPASLRLSRRTLLKGAVAGSAAACLVGAPQPSRADLFMPSVAEQKKVGQQAAQQILQKYHELHDARADHFERVGERLVDALPAKDRNTWDFSFHVLDSKEINAFALPGGPMFMFTGLMDRVHSDDELAAVTGHEMTHVRKQHWAKAAAKQQERSIGIGLLLGLTHAGQVWQLAAGGINTVIGLKYSRTEEDEADAGGLENMVAAGYDPHGMLDLFHTLETASGSHGGPPAFLSDHPLTSERIKKTQERINRMGR